MSDRAAPRQSRRAPPAVLPAPAHGARARIHRAALRLFAERGARDVSVSDLAEAAGIARGTIYNNLAAPDALFADVVGEAARAMIARTETTMRGIEDPTERIATAIRLFVRHAADDPDWGRFLVRFAFADGMLNEMMRAPPARDIAAAIAQGRFTTPPEMVPALVTMLTGATLAAVNAVLHGEQGWRDAGGAAAELFLRAGGVAPAQARKVASRPLPNLAGDAGGDTPAAAAATRVRRRKP